jgi:hypothetical protein
VNPTAASAIKAAGILFFRNSNTACFPDLVNEAVVTNT